MSSGVTIDGTEGCCAIDNPGVHMGTTMPSGVIVHCSDMVKKWGTRDRHAHFRYEHSALAALASSNENYGSAHKL